MEKVTGIGVFFRAREPKVLAPWYREHLGAEIVPANYEDPLGNKKLAPLCTHLFPETRNILEAPANSGSSIFV
jgi:hypothetical protein